MFYLQIIKKISESIKNNEEISEEVKTRAKEILNELARLLSMY